MVPMKRQLEGKVAVITGAASGIGRAAAELFVDAGAKVVLADISDDQGVQLEHSLGADAAYVHADVTSEADIESAVATAWSIMWATY